jgi:hypothetical protein
VTDLEAVSGRPLVLSEIGVDSKNKDAWLAGLGGFLGANKRIVGFVYYNTSKQTTGATGYYRIDQRASYTAALRSTLAQLPDPEPGADQRCH